MAKITKLMIAACVAIANAPNGFLLMTEAEGADIVNAGLATVDAGNIQGDKAPVVLTEAGKKLAAENQTAPVETAPVAAVAVNAKSSGFEIDDGVEMPTDSKRRGRETGYPFDKLEIGQSFHVPTTSDNTDPASRLASSVSGARLRFSEPTGATETVEVKTYVRHESGKGFAKDADGKRIVESTKTEERPVLRMTRDFAVKAVGPNDPKGEGARVWRVACANG